MLLLQILKLAPSAATAHELLCHHLSRPGLAGNGGYCPGEDAVEEGA